MREYARRKTCAVFKPILIGIAMLIPSVMMHEVGHVIACIWQGFELIEFNLLGSYIICSEYDNQIVHIMGGAVGGASMLSFLLAKKIRAYLPVSLGLACAGATQLLNMLLEGFANSAYRAYSLENMVLVFGVIIVVSAAFLLFPRSQK
ncbi:MAG: hypothetical protein OXC46_07340 [Thaumarchaeota archaeon]|nr:hypothetical protein [Nitrososphaerota archaeon]